MGSHTSVESDVDLAKNSMEQPQGRSDPLVLQFILHIVMLEVLPDPHTVALKPLFL